MIKNKYYIGQLIYWFDWEQNEIKSGTIFGLEKGGPDIRYFIYPTERAYVFVQEHYQYDLYSDRVALQNVLGALKKRRRGWHEVS